MGEMVVVTVTDYYYVDYGYVGEMAGSFCVSFGTYPCERRAAILKNWIK